MRVAVIHDAVREDDAPDAADVLVQVEAVAGALKAQGHQTATLACTLDLDAVRRELRRFGPELVFNLVESLEGQGRLIHFPPFLLDSLAIPYTGAPAEAMLMTSNKVMAKRRMAEAGLSTPRWIGPGAGPPYGCGPAEILPGAWIIKSTWEHASIGLDAGSLMNGVSAEELAAALCDRAPQLGGDCFAERYVDGREFNLSLLAGIEGPQVLPPAEIVFEGYGAEQPRIVDYRAKWEIDSFEYRHTPRRFDFDTEDAALLALLKQQARRCWHVFGLRGYARVDFRVDAEGRPWILEVNANPCLSPDAGYAAALERAGISFANAVRRICVDAMGRNHTSLY